MKNSRTQILMILSLIVLFTLLIFHGVIFRPGVVFGKDTVNQGYPLNWAAYQAEKVHNPQAWFPYMMSGFPMVSAQPYYPPDWLLRGLYVTRAITWRYVIHTMLAAFLMFALMRRFKRSLTASVIGAMCFAFSGFFISKIYAGHGGAIWAGIWIPGVLLFLDLAIETRRARYAILTGAMIAMQVLAQHAQYCYYSALAMLLYAAWRILPAIFRKHGLKTLASYAGLAIVVVIFVFLISAPILLPFLQQAAISNRGGGTSYDFATSLSLHPEQLITALTPSFWGSPTRQNSVFGALYWDGSMFIGVIPLIFAIIAVFVIRDSKARYFKFLALFSVLIALGDSTPVFRLMYNVPGFSMARAPSKILYLYTFAVAALAAYGVDLLLNSAERLRMQSSRQNDRMTRHARVAMCKSLNLFTVSSVCCTILLITWCAAKGPILTFAKMMIANSYKDPISAMAKMNGLYQLQAHTIAWAAVFSTAGVSITLALLRRWIRPMTAAAVIVLLTFIDLCMYANPMLHTVDARKAYLGGDRGAIEIIKSDPDRFRVLPLDNASFQYFQGVFDNIESVNGYYPISIGRYATYVGAIENKPRYVSVSADIKRADSPLVGMLNVKYVISSSPLKLKNLVEVYSGKAHVYYNRNWLPRAYSVHNAKTVSDPDAALAAIKQPKFDARTTVILESDRPLSKNTENPAKDKIRYLHYTSDEFAIRADMKSDGYLVVSEIYYPSWKAYVDGKEAKILPADYLFRGIYLTKGNHIVRMHYVDSLNQTGSKLASSGMAFVVGMLLLGLVRRNKDGSSGD